MHTHDVILSVSVVNLDTEGEYPVKASIPFHCLELKVQSKIIHVTLNLYLNQ